MGMSGGVIRPPWPVPARRGGKRATDDRLDLLEGHRNAASRLLTKVVPERIVFHGHVPLVRNLSSYLGTELVQINRFSAVGESPNC
jgi:hypothetical protein